MVGACLGTSDGVVHILGVDAPEEVPRARPLCGGVWSTPEGLMVHL